MGKQTFNIVLGVSLAIIVILFIVHLIRHLTAKRKCHFCSSGEKATWLGRKTDTAYQEPKDAKMRIFSSLFQHQMERSSRLEMCDSCHHQMKHVGKDWKYHENGIRNRMRDWDQGI